MTRNLDHIAETFQIAAERRRTGRPVWERHIRLGDIFHNDDMPFEQRRDAIVARIRESGWLDGRDEYDELVAAVNEGLTDAEDAEEFDDIWDVVYDWADIDRVWIDTMGWGVKP